MESGFARSSDVHRRIVVRYENRFVFGVSELLAVPVSARQALTDTQSNKLVGVRRFELPAPASRRQLGVYKLLLLLGILETLVDASA